MSLYESGEGLASILCRESKSRLDVRNNAQMVVVVVVFFFFH